MAKSDVSQQAVVNIHDAKTNLSKLLARVEAGESITIARNGTPVARLVPVQAAKRSDVFGCMSHLPPLPDDFLDPDPEIEEMFGMR
jgi:prevent-host-death family protein